MSESKPTSVLSPEEDMLIGETPAFLCNKFYVTSNPYGVKITFAEGFFADGKQEFRSRCAVYLVPSDLLELHQLIDRIVQSFQPVLVDDKVPS